MYHRTWRETRDGGCCLPFTGKAERANSSQPNLLVDINGSLGVHVGNVYSCITAKTSWSFQPWSGYRGCRQVEGTAVMISFLRKGRLFTKGNSIGSYPVHITTTVDAYNHSRCQNICEGVITNALQSCNKLGSGHLGCLMQ